MSRVGRTGGKKVFSYKDLRQEVAKMFREEFRNLKGKPLSQEETEKSDELAKMLSSKKTIEELGKIIT